MLSPVPVAIRVESNIFAPAPTVSAVLFVPVQTKRQRRMVPVNVPPYEEELVSVQSVNVPVAAPPITFDPNPSPETMQRKNTPLAIPAG